MATSRGRRISALEKLRPMQRGDFEGLFRAMNGRPVIIRLLDPPLHEFLPSYDHLVQDLVDLKVQIQHFHTLNEIDQALAEVRRKEDILTRVEALKEANPMLGLRGDRLSIVMPEISEMQIRAILEAAVLVKRDGVDVHPEIMIPLTSHVNELKFIRKILDTTAKAVFEEMGESVDFKYGTMIEVPRAALTADEMAGGSGILQLWDQRPDPDHLRHQPGRRRGQVSHQVCGERDTAPEPLSATGHPGRRQADRDGGNQWTSGAAGPACGHLRRARRRSPKHRLLPPGGAGLCELQSLPGAHRPSGGGPCGHQRRELKESRGKG